MRDISVEIHYHHHRHTTGCNEYIVRFLEKKKKKKIGQSAIQEAIKSETARRQSARGMRLASFIISGVCQPNR